MHPTMFKAGIAIVLGMLAMASAVSVNAPEKRVRTKAEKSGRGSQHMQKGRPMYGVPGVAPDRSKYKLGSKYKQTEPHFSRPLEENDVESDVLGLRTPNRLTDGAARMPDGTLGPNRMAFVSPKQAMQPKRRRRETVYGVAPDSPEYYKNRELDRILSECIRECIAPHVDFYTAEPEQIAKVQKDKECKANCEEQNPALKTIQKAKMNPLYKRGEHHVNTEAFVDAKPAKTDVLALTAKAQVPVARNNRGQKLERYMKKVEDGVPGARFQDEFDADPFSRKSGRGPFFPRSK